MAVGMGPVGRGIFGVLALRGGSGCGVMERERPVLSLVCGQHGRVFLHLDAGLVAGLLYERGL